MENFNAQGKNPKNIGKKIFKYLILLVVLLLTYSGVFYLGNILATKGVILALYQKKQLVI